MSISADTVNRQWILKHRPKGDVTPDDFRYEENEVPTVAQDGDVLVRVVYFGFDASQHVYVSENGGYMNPVMPGDPMRTMGIGQVIESKDPNYQPGMMVTGFMAWSDYVICRADGPMPLTVIPPVDYPLSWNLGIFGVGGLTAYFGIMGGLKVKAGDTVVISAATGATGAVACQIAKLLGARVIGVAGGPEKCQWIKDKAGCDEAIDYRNDNFREKIQEYAPEGVDCYFDNVGGQMLEDMLWEMKPLGRVLICGAMSQSYLENQTNVGPGNYMQICVKQLTVEGILLFFYADQIPKGIADLGQWVQEGKILVEESLHEGFEKAPELLPTLFSGKAPGKMILKIADPE
jgi:NADPH-dependent curcumin reductase CurA